MVQWLRLCAPNAEGPGSILGKGARSHMLQLRVHMLQQRLEAAKKKKKGTNTTGSSRVAQWL